MTKSHEEDEHYQREQHAVASVGDEYQDRDHRRDKVADFGHENASSLSSPQPTHHGNSDGPRHGQTTSASTHNHSSQHRASQDKSSGGAAVIPADASDAEESPPWKAGGVPQSTMVAPAAAAKSGGGGGARRLTFADENGGALAEVNYSNRTHYSKQTGPSSLSGPGRACCAIS